MSDHGQVIYHIAGATALQIYSQVNTDLGAAEANEALLQIFKAFALAAIATSGKVAVAQVWNDAIRSTTLPSPKPRLSLVKSDG